jgi:hypothetical protein
METVNKSDIPACRLMDAIYDGMNALDAEYGPVEIVTISHHWDRMAGAVNGSAVVVFRRRDA